MRLLKDTFDRFDKTWDTLIRCAAINRLYVHFTLHFTLCGKIIDLLECRAI